MSWIEVFKTGTHTDSAGNTREWSDADLDAIVQAYNAQKDHQAPLVIGHPQTDAPAYGWVKSLRRVGDRLQAFMDQVSDGVKQAVAAGHFKKVSVALYPNKLLRHVGLLGATPPAVKGLQPVRFNANETYTEYEIMGDNKKDQQQTAPPATPPATPATPPATPPALPENALFEELSGQIKVMEKAIKELGADNAKLRNDNLALAAKLSAGEFNEFLNDLIRQGRVLDAERDALAEEYGDLYKADQVMTFAEGEKSLVQKFKERLSARAVLIEPPRGSHFATPDRAKNTVTVPPGFDAQSVNPESAELDRKATEYMEKHTGVNYEQAIQAVL